jgi:Domain of unknown function (DUF4439)
VVSEHGGRHEGQVLAATSSARLPVPRRTVLAGAAGVAGVLLAGGLAGCSTEAPASASTPSSTPTRSADDLALARARGAALELAALAQALAAARPDLDGLLQDVVADHRAHLVALGAAPAASAPSPSPSKGGADAADVQALVDAETAAAQTALDDVRLVTPGLAALLARIAAARATHADLLASTARLRMPGVLRTSPATAGTGPAATTPSPAPLPGAAPAGTPTPSPPPGTGEAAALPDAARGALAALTSGEHAAVYAYGAIVARVKARQRDRARNAWAWHLARRDVLEERLLAAGVQPPTAAPAYDLGSGLGSASAVALAVTVEDRLAVLAARAVAATTGGDRSDAAEGLVAGARRAAAWRGRGESLPG